MKPHPQHVAIAKALGTTPGALKGLLSIKGGRSSGNRGAWLEELGLVVPAPLERRRFGYWVLTPAGADLLARARALGY